MRERPSVRVLQLLRGVCGWAVVGLVVLFLVSFWREQAVVQEREVWDQEGFLKYAVYEVRVGRGGVMVREGFLAPGAEESKTPYDDLDWERHWLSIEGPMYPALPRVEGGPGEVREVEGEAGAQARWFQGTWFGGVEAAEHGGVAPLPVVMLPVAVGWGWLTWRGRREGWDRRRGRRRWATWSAWVCGVAAIGLCGVMAVSYWEKQALVVYRFEKGKGSASKLVYLHIEAGLGKLAAGVSLHPKGFGMIDGVTRNYWQFGWEHYAAYRWFTSPSGGGILLPMGVGLNDGVQGVVMPMPVVIGAAGVWPGVRAVGWWRRRRAARAGGCVRCGYDLRASPEQCPECGWEVARE